MYQIVITLLLVCFNSRTLGRVRLPPGGRSRLFWSVSIHAPWEGCDEKKTNGRRDLALSFNSRTLGRVRRVLHHAQHTLLCVSIHAPWEGCDSSRPASILPQRVSIHAPWEGCDLACHHSRLDVIAVSIHAPWEGCDSSTSPTPYLSWHSFQFTHPGKGATSRWTACWQALPFQFTHPGKGATGCSPLHPTQCHSFNSRTLGRVRLVSLVVSMIEAMFQFTHPGKGATAGVTLP